MNFLAHFHLAWPEADLVAGGLEGDYRKGPLPADAGDGLAQGVRLHRAIDAFTDDHAAVRRLRAQFPRPLRRYAGIVIDIGFDYCLTRHWPRYADLSLRHFSDEVYRILAQWQPQLSAGGRAMSAVLATHDVLNRYHEWEAVAASAERIGERLRRGNPLGGNPLRGSAGHLAALQAPVETTFHAFYPELVQFARDTRAALAAAPPAPGRDSSGHCQTGENPLG